MFDNLKAAQRWPLTNKIKNKFYLVVFLTILVSLTSNFGIVMMGPLAKAVVSNQPPSNLWEEIFANFIGSYSQKTQITIISVIFLAVSFLKLITLYFYSFQTATLIYEFRRHYTVNTFNKYILSTMDYIAKKKVGVLISNIFNQPAMASDCVNVVLQYIRIIISLITAVVLLFLTSFQIASIVFIGLTILYLIAGYARPIFRKIGEDIIKVSQDTNAVGNESLTAIKQVKLYNLEQKKKDLFATLAERQKNIYVKNYFLQVLPGNSYEFIFALSGIAFIIIYTSFIGNIENIVSSLVIIAGLGLRIFSNLFSLIEKRYNIFSFFPAFKFVMKMAEDAVAQEDFDSGEEISVLNQDIQFHDVSFHYPDGEYVFKNLTFNIPAGKTTVILGPSGCGKSTLVDLITGFYIPQHGEVLINGIKIQNLNLELWRSKIGFVAQNVFLFNDTIKNNIDVSDTAKHDDELYYYANAAHCHEFINELPNGYETTVGNSTGLSGGQAQRISIARALLRKPELYIFDEATSALDKVSNKIVNQNIKEITHGKTTIIITHNESMAAKADNVIDFKQLISHE